MKLRILAVLLCLPAFGYAAPDCISADSDPDGDGWGWEYNQSCRVVGGGTPPPVDAGEPACVDTDGDGWGWDGVQSCRVDPAAPPAITEGESLWWRYFLRGGTDGARAGWECVLTWHLTDYPPTWHVAHGGSVLHIQYWNAGVLRLESIGQNGGSQWVQAMRAEELEGQFDITSLNARDEGRFFTDVFVDVQLLSPTRMRVNLRRSFDQPQPGELLYHWYQCDLANQ